jgi:hypothetical protein
MACRNSYPAARGRRVAVAGGLVALGLIAWAPVALAQDSTEYDLSKVSPDVYTTIYEDDSIWVFEAFYEPGHKGKVHSHKKPYVVYTIEGTTFRITNEDGSVRDLVLKPRSHFESQPWHNHWGWNTDTENQARFIIVQPK